jgi:hypothetical protein
VLLYLSLTVEYFHKPPLTFPFAFVPRASFGRASWPANSPKCVGREKCLFTRGLGHSPSVNRATLTPLVGDRLVGHRQVVDVGAVSLVVIY